MNTQQSGGTGRNSLWIECHQFALSLDRNSGLLIPSNSAGGSVAQSLPLFSQQGQQSKKENKTNYLQSSCHYPTSSSGFGVKFLTNLESLAAATRSVTCSDCSKNLSEFQSWTFHVLSQNFKLVSSSCFFPSFLLRKAPYHHTSKILLRYVQI